MRSGEVHSTSVRRESRERSAFSVLSILACCILLLQELDMRLKTQASLSLAAARVFCLVPKFLQREKRKRAFKKRSKKKGRGRAMRQEQEAKGRLIVSHLACFHLVLPVRLPDTRAPCLYYFSPLPLGSWYLLAYGQKLKKCPGSRGEGKTQDSWQDSHAREKKTPTQH